MGAYALQLSFAAVVSAIALGALPAAVNGSSDECGWLAGCSITNFDTDQSRLLDSSSVHVYSLGEKTDSFSIRCDVVAPPNAPKNSTGVNWVEFQYGNGESHKDFVKPYWMGGDAPRWTTRPKYLGTTCPERKSVRVLGRVWGQNEPCFDETFELFAQCDGFDITLSLDHSVVDAKPFVDAAERWSQIITGDIAPVIGFGEFVEPFEDCTYSHDVDDLEICGMLRPIDDSAVLAYAGPDYIRAESNLPINGLMIINSNLEGSTDLLQKTILREMGHVLGVGSLWETAGMAEADTASCSYSGARAIEEFGKISGCDGSREIPLEHGVGMDSRCTHWAEACFGDELMTPLSSNVGDAEPLSQITAAALEDLGYEVSFDLVDEITSNDLSPSCRCDQQASRRLTGWRQVSSDRPHRKLRKDTEELAKSLARHLLEKRVVSRNAVPENVRYVGDQVVIVYVEQEGLIYDVLVTKEKAPN